MAKFISNPFTNQLGNLGCGVPKAKQIPRPGEGLPRYAHFNADQSGCGFWRMIWPAEQLLVYNKAVVSTLYQMVLDPNFYRGTTAVRLQRQCTENQYKFVKHLRKVSDQLKNKTGEGFKLIWEVDDLVCPVDDIPDYNKCKEAFTNPQILDTVKRIVNLCDEMTVVSPRMREHYKKHLSYDKISVIPNYVNRNWVDGLYDKSKLMQKYETGKNSKFRIGYAGSPTHFDVANRANQKDDFYHVVDSIIERIDDYDFVFFGGYPKKLLPYVQSGKVQHMPWGNLDKYPKLLDSLNLNLMIAPLMDNAFSASKSNIKFLEGAVMGVPCVTQDIAAYEVSPWKFTDSDGMFDHIENILKSEESYEEASDLAWKIAGDYWLDEHLDEIKLIYDTPYGDSIRKDHKFFLKNNAEQFDKPSIPVYTV
jgi:glycosyltransferase involved in cell wall biosynthesis